MAKLPPGRTRLLIGVAVAVAIGIVGWGMLHNRGSQDITYRFGTVERGNIQQTVSATGNLGAVKTVQVGTQVSGQVIAEYADFNDIVAKGQLLARIDPTLQEQSVRDAEAQLASAKAQLARAQDEYDRNAPLAKAQFISASEFGTFEVNRSVAIAGVRSAQVSLDRAQKNLSYTNIYAPIKGVVVERNVDVGQTVAASLSAPQIYLIAQDLAQMQILAAVDESDIANIKDGQDVQFTVQSFQGRTFKGTVDQVRLQSQTTDNVVSYTVVVKVDNPDGSLLPGMTATLAFVTGAASGVLTVPNAALRFKPSAEELAKSGLAATDSTARRAARGSSGQSDSNGRGSSALSDSAGRGSAARADSTSRGAAASTGRGSAIAGTRVGLPPRTTSGTLYTVDASGKLHAIRVRVGLADAQRTAVSGNDVVAGMQVIIGSSGGTAATPSAATTNPLAPQRTQGRGGRGGA